MCVNIYIYVCVCVFIYIYMIEVYRKWKHVVCAPLSHKASFAHHTLSIRMCMLGILGILQLARAACARPQLKIERDEEHNWAFLLATNNSSVTEIPCVDLNRFRIDS